MTGEGAPPAPPDVEESDSGDDRLRQLLLVELSEPVARRRSSLSPSRVRRLLFPASLVVLLTCGVALVGLGARVVSNSTSGRVVRPVVDPESPGFEALVDPTPTLALVTVDDDDLVGVVVLTLARGQEAGGGFVIVPQRTVGALPLLGENPLESSFEFGDADSLVDALGVLLDLGIAERAVVDDARWAELVAPVAPIVLDNPNALFLDDEQLFEVGPLELTADEVGPYLRAEARREGDLERLYRHELFFTAWLDAVADHGGVDAVPGEIDSGIGRFVRALAPGPVDVVTLPVSEDESAEFGPDAFMIDAERATPLLQRLVPCPRRPNPELGPASGCSTAPAISPRPPASPRGCHRPAWRWPSSAMPLERCRRRRCVMGTPTSPTRRGGSPSSSMSRRSNSIPGRATRSTSRLRSDLTPEAYASSPRAREPHVRPFQPI